MKRIRENFQIRRNCWYFSRFIFTDLQPVISLIDDWLLCILYLFQTLRNTFSSIFPVARMKLSHSFRLYYLSQCNCFFSHKSFSALNCHISYYLCIKFSSCFPLLIVRDHCITYIPSNLPVKPLNTESFCWEQQDLIISMSIADIS